MADTLTARDPRIVEATDPRAVLRGFYGDQSHAMDMMAWADGERDAFAASILAEVGAQMNEDSYPPLHRDRVLIHTIEATATPDGDEEAHALAELARWDTVYTAARATERQARIAMEQAEQGYDYRTYEAAKLAYDHAQDDRAEAYLCLCDAEMLFAAVSDID